MSPKTLWSLYCGLCLGVVLTAAASSDSADLARTHPVPSTEKIPTADFFKTAVLRDPKINPDGTHIAALVTTAEDHYGLLNYDIETKKFETLGFSGDKDIYAFGWLGGRRLFYFISSEKLYGIAVYGVNINNLGRSYPLLQYQGASMVGIPPKNRSFPLIWAHFDAFNQNRDGGVVVVDANIENGKAVDLTVADVPMGASRDAEEENERHIRTRYPAAPGGLGLGYYTAREGNLELAVTESKGVESLYRLEGEEWIKCPVDLDNVDFITTGNVAGEALVIGPRTPGKARSLQSIECKTGKLQDVVMQDENYDFVGYLYRDPVSQAVVGAYYETNGPRVRWFTADYANLQKLLDGFFPGMLVHLIGSDDHGKIFLVSVRSDRQPSIYYSVNLETKQVGLIKSSQPWIDPKRMQPMNTIKFKTRDGHKLDAFVTLPAGASKQNPAPLVVLPHGGPWARDSWGFDGETQFLASRGYAVLQPNYRGSPGYSWMFPTEDEWDFVKMGNDVTDATKAVLASGYVDPNRVAIMGSSFGGYLALSGAVNTPDLYKCAVMVAGVFDWEELIKEKKYDQFTTSEYSWLMRRLGDPAKLRDKFAEISPLRHVDRAHIPMLVSHGTEDRRVDVSESRELIRELEKHNIPHESFIVRGEGHGMHHVNHEVELYNRIDAFLAKYLTPTTPAVPTEVLQPAKTGTPAGAAPKT